MAVVFEEIKNYANFRIVPLKIGPKQMPFFSNDFLFARHG